MERVPVVRSDVRLMVCRLSGKLAANRTGAGATTMFATMDTSARWTRRHIPGGQLANEDIIENGGGCWKLSTQGTREKADSSPRSKNRTGFGMTYFLSFPAGC